LRASSPVFVVGGAVLLKAVDDRLDVAERLARRLRDPRQPGKIDDELNEWVWRRVYGIACGYADCDDGAPPPREAGLVPRWPEGGA